MAELKRFDIVIANPPFSQTYSRKTYSRTQWRLTLACPSKLGYFAVAL